MICMVQLAPGPKDGTFSILFSSKTQLQVPEWEIEYQHWNVECTPFCTYKTLFFSLRIVTVFGVRGFAFAEVVHPSLHTIIHKSCSSFVAYRTSQVCLEFIVHNL